MSEKMCTRLLRLYPSRFRKKYEDEALQLIRDRLSDETGFFKRSRLWRDLLLDVLAGLPQAYRNSYAATEAASISATVEGIPSFNVLDEEPLGSGSILLGGTLSLAIIVAFGFFLNRSMAHLPVPGSNGRISPIEAVMERLIRAATPDRVIRTGCFMRLISNARQCCCWGARKPAVTAGTAHMFRKAEKLFAAYLRESRGSGIDGEDDNDS